MFVSSSKLVYWLFFYKDQTSEGAKAFLDVAGQMDDVAFGITSADAVFGEYKLDKDGVILFKKVGFFRSTVQVLWCASDFAFKLTP